MAEKPQHIFIEIPVDGDGPSPKKMPVTKWICSRQLTLLTIVVMGFLAGIGFGIWCGNLCGLWWGIVIGCVSSLAGAIASLIVWDMIGDCLLHKDLGVSDVRHLKWGELSCLRRSSLRAMIMNSAIQGIIILPAKQIEVTTLTSRCRICRPAE